MTVVSSTGLVPNRCVDLCQQGWVPNSSVGETQLKTVVARFDHDTDRGRASQFILNIRNVSVGQGRID